MDKDTDLDRYRAAINDDLQEWFRLMTEYMCIYIRQTYVKNIRGGRRIVLTRSQVRTRLLSIRPKQQRED